MRYLSVCSGVEAATLAWEPLGWQPVAFSEVDAAASAVLAHRWPGVDNLGDMSRFEEWPDADVDLLIGGTPCQSFSVAGLRKGLDDPRGNLMLVFGAIARRYRPGWLVWENVPGVLSSNRGRDFGALLGLLGELGYGFAYRILDARYFGVAQRRRRVFVVGCAGGWRRAAAVLFEQHCLQGDSAPGREAWTAVAAAVPAGDGAAGGRARAMMVASTGEISHCLNAGGMGRQDYESETLIGYVPMAFDCKAGGNTGFAVGNDCAGALRGDGSGGGHAAVYSHAHGIRRLTPTECERLQGMPDGHTLAPYRGRLMADGPRYRMIGNSMAVPVMRWIGERIAAVDAITSGMAMERCG